MVSCGSLLWLVVLCGVVWCCVVLCGVVWCCVVLCGVVWCCVVFHVRFFFQLLKIFCLFLSHCVERRHTWLNLLTLGYRKILI